VAFEELKDILKGKVTLGAGAAPLTTYHLGGPLGALAEPKDLEDLGRLMAFLHARQGKYLVLGGGSNVVFADEGFDGVGIRLGRGFQGIQVEGDRLRVKAGTRLVTLMNRAREAHLGGLEFCAGIPGNVGGAVVGNAGARREWIGTRVEEVTVVTGRGEVKTLGMDQYRVGYRHSTLKESGDLVVEAVVRADREPAAVIEAKIKDYFQNRRGKQPRTEPNAGSVFKNPEGDSAGRMAEELGLKGFRVGGARVSEVHANFIVSDGGTAGDVVKVMREVQGRVREMFGVRLEPEVLPLGDWDWEAVGDVWWNRTGPVFYRA